MNLKEIVNKWLWDEFPNWKITNDPTIVSGEVCDFIYFKPMNRWLVWLFADRVEFDDDKRGPRFVLMAHDTRFFELLWNRLHAMESGFQRAMASRDFHRPESK